MVDDRGARFEDGGRSFDRQPPQDITAEQSVLGGMLLSKDAIADVVEVLRPGDFYRPAHQALYDCVLDLYGRGEPADAVTVSAELERRGELLRVGGAPYLHTLISTVPTAATAPDRAVNWPSSRYRCEGSAMMGMAPIRCSAK